MSGRTGEAKVADLRERGGGGGDPLAWAPGGGSGEGGVGSSEEMRKERRTYLEITVCVE